MGSAAISICHENATGLWSWPDKWFGHHCVNLILSALHIHTHKHTHNTSFNTSHCPRTPVNGQFCQHGRYDCSGALSGDRYIRIQAAILHTIGRDERCNMACNFTNFMQFGFNCMLAQNVKWRRIWNLKITSPFARGLGWFESHKGVHTLNAIKYYVICCPRQICPSIFVNSQPPLVAVRLFMFENIFQVKNITVHRFLGIVDETVGPFLMHFSFLWEFHNLPTQRKWSL